MDIFLYKVTQHRRRHVNYSVPHHDSGGNAVVEIGFNQVQ